MAFRSNANGIRSKESHKSRCPNRGRFVEVAKERDALRSRLQEMQNELERERCRYRRELRKRNKDCETVGVGVVAQYIAEFSGRLDGARFEKV